MPRPCAGNCVDHAARRASARGAGTGSPLASPLAPPLAPPAAIQFDSAAGSEKSPLQGRLKPALPGSPPDCATDRRLEFYCFHVDASGSAALHRLAEAKGAVDLLFADCYVRREPAWRFW